MCLHTEPQYLALLKQRLMEEEETLKKQNASYVFYLNNVYVNSKELTVTLLGDRKFFLAGQQTTLENCGYTLHFNYSGARLLLKGIIQEKTDLA